jgi:hypothetical protein
MEGITMSKKRMELTTTEIQWIISSLKKELMTIEADLQKMDDNRTIKSLLQLDLDNKKDLISKFESKLKA